jgi:hypothetical protein
MSGQMDNVEYYSTTRHYIGSSFDDLARLHRLALLSGGERE